MEYLTNVPTSRFASSAEVNCEAYLIRISRYILQHTAGYAFWNENEHILFYLSFPLISSTEILQDNLFEKNI